MKYINLFENMITLLLLMRATVLISCLESANEPCSYDNMINSIILLFVFKLMRLSCELYNELKQIIDNSYEK